VGTWLVMVSFPITRLPLFWSEILDVWPYGAYSWRKEYHRNQGKQLASLWFCCTLYTLFRLKKEEICCLVSRSQQQYKILSSVMTYSKNLHQFLYIYSSQKPQSAYFYTPVSPVNRINLNEMHLSVYLGVSWSALYSWRSWIRASWYSYESNQ